MSSLEHSADEIRALRTRIAELEAELRKRDSSSVAQGNPLPVDDLTARLGMAEARETLLGDLTPQAVWESRPDGYLTYCNPYWFELTGQTHPEELGAGWIRAVHEADRERISELWKQLTPKPSDWELELRIRRASDGAYRWHLVKGVPIFGRTGKVERWIGVGIDIHERHLAQLERDRFFALGLDLRVILGVDGRFVRVSPQWTEILGWSMEELTSRPWGEFVHPDDLAESVDVAQKLILGQPILAFENRYLTKDGGYRWLSWRAQPYPEEGLYYAAAADITPRKEALRALAASEHRWRTMIETASEGVWLTDLHARTTFVNARMASMLGYTTADLMSSTFWRFLAPDERERALEGFRRRRGGSMDAEEYRFLHRNGETRWMSVTGSLVSDESGQPTGILALFTDVTKRRKAEEERAAADRRAAHILESISDGFVTFDHEWRYSYVNQRAASLLRTTVEELSGKVVWDVFPEVVGSQTHREMLRVMREHQPAEFDAYAPELDMWFRHSAYPTSDGVALYFQDVTPERKREQEREAMRLMLERVLNQMPVGVVMAEAPSGRLIFGNREVEAIWRHPYETSEDVSGYNVYRGFHPDGREYASEEWPLARALRGDTIVREEIDYLRGDGTRGTLVASAGPVRDASGQIVAAVVAFSDITAQREVERERQASEERFRTLAETLPAVVYTANPDGDIDYGNPHALEYSGMSAEEAGTGAWLTALHPDDRESTSKRWKESIATGSVFSFEYRIRRASDGEYRWHLARAVPVRNETGRIVKWVGAALDIHDRYELEAALAASEARYKALINATSAVVWRTDGEGRFVERQPMWEEYTGQTWQEHAGFGWKQALHPEDVSRVVADWEAAVRGSAVLYQTHGRLWHASSEQYRFFEAQAVSLANPDGSLREWIGTVSDVHERKTAEDALRASHQALARANLDLEQFAYSASHDLQEPLRTINSFAQLLAERYRDKLDRDGEEFIDYITGSATRMQKLIRDLLAYSRVLHAPNTPEDLFRTVDLNEVLASVKRQLAVSLHEKNATIESDPLPTVRGDASQLGLVLQNLISNAIKYARPGIAPHILVEAEKRPEEWLIRVSDEGIGFDPEQAERIFGLFKRLHGREVDGTGIGLTIARRVIERHGGRIWARSEGEGHGAVFTFSLPLSDGELIGVEA